MYPMLYKMHNLKRFGSNQIGLSNEKAEFVLPN